MSKIHSMMTTSVLPDDVVQAVLDQFERLPKTGKPQSHEYTVLAALVLAFKAPQGTKTRVIAMATGTKCLGASQRDPGGLALNDCHAEVLVRRALLQYMYAEAEQLLLAESLVEQQAGCLLKLADIQLQTRADDAPHQNPAPITRSRFHQTKNASLHLFISQPPCGDACIIENENGALNHVDDDAPSSSSLLGSGRTGAKLLVLPSSLPETEQQHHQPVVVTDAHDTDRTQQLSSCRRKPGRGESTLSMSCSDKLARWILLGLQGSFWSEMLDGMISLSSVVVLSSPGMALGPAEAALRRALLGRLSSDSGKHPLEVHVLAPDVNRLERLGLAPSAARRSAAGGCLVWHASVPGSQRGAFLEGLTGVLGLRAGHRRRVGELIKPSAASALCKCHMARRAAELRKRFLYCLSEEEETNCSTMPYGRLKQMWALAYQNRWNQLRSQDSFRAWIPKPEDTFPVSLNEFGRHNNSSHPAKRQKLAG